MNSSKLFLTLLFMVSIALCQITIKGKVVDTLGNPIHGAQVALSVAGLKDTTDSTGQFVLVSNPTEGQSNQYKKPFLGNPFIKNHVLFFSVFHPGTQIMADVFSVSGRLVAHVLNKSFLKGDFHLDLASLLQNSSKNAIYFVRLKIGNETFTLKWAIQGITSCKTGGSSSTVWNSLSKNTASADTRMVDTIIVTRDGYYDEYKVISSYATDVGLIKLFNGKMPTIQEQDTIKMAINGIGMAISKIDTTISTDSAMKQMLVQCDTMKTIDSMWISGSFVCASIKNGGMICWDFTKDSSNMLSLQKTGMSHRSVFSKVAQVGNSACILSGGGDSVKKSQGDLVYVYNNIRPYYSVVDTIYNKKFTLQFITNELYKYDLVFLLTHGINDKYGTFFLTGETADISSILKCYYGEWKNNLVRINLPIIGNSQLEYFSGADWLLMVSNRYIAEKCDKQFNARLWYAATCNQLTMPEQMGKALIDRGVKEVIGWNCEVISTDADVAGDYLIGTMLETCQTLGEVYNSIPNDSKYLITWGNLKCNLTACYTPTMQPMGMLRAYPDTHISTSTFKLRNDCPTPPQMPTLISPSNGATGQPLSPTLTWSTVTGAATYHVQVSTSNTFTTVVIEDSTLTSAMKVLSVLINGTQYFWRVQAKNEGGVSAWSSSWSFTTITATVKQDSVTDIDGNVYHTVRIGTQVWTVENLRTTKYIDGSAIPFVIDNSIWLTHSSPGYCYYNNTTNTDSIKLFGALYNWYAVNTKKLAPSGWHVPMDAEWDTLQNYLIVNGYNWDGTKTGNKIAKSLAARANWWSNSSAGAIGNDLTKNNSSGFSALPAGYRYVVGNFNYIGYFGSWWSATGTGADIAYCSSLANNNDSLIRTNDFEGCGFSVRLVRDN